MSSDTSNTASASVSDSRKTRDRVRPLPGSPTPPANHLDSPMSTVDVVAETELSLYAGVFSPESCSRESDLEQGAGFCLVDEDEVVAVSGWPARSQESLPLSAGSVAVKRGLERATALYPERPVTVVLRTTPSCTPSVFPELESICTLWTPEFRERVFSVGVSFRSGLSRPDKAGLLLAERLGWAGQIRAIDGVLSETSGSLSMENVEQQEVAPNEVVEPVRLYTDASEGANHSGFGFVILDAKNRVVSLRAGLSEATDTNGAEFNGLLRGVEAVMSHEAISEVRIVTDSKVVKESVESETAEADLEYRFYQSRVQGVLEELDEWEIYHQRRRFNRLADALATCSRSRSLKTPETP